MVAVAVWKDIMRIILQQMNYNVQFVHLLAMQKVDLDVQSDASS